MGNKSPDLSALRLYAIQKGIVVLIQPPRAERYENVIVFKHRADMLIDVRKNHDLLSCYAIRNIGVAGLYFLNCVKYGGYVLFRAGKIEIGVDDADSVYFFLFQKST